MDEQNTRPKVDVKEDFNRILEHGFFKTGPPLKTEVWKHGEVTVVSFVTDTIQVAFTAKELRMMGESLIELSKESSI